MRVYYALYDQSYDNNAQYWTWFPEEITKQMRDAIASKSGAFQMRPKRPNLLTEPDIVGGIINYQDQWCVVFRFFNGGNDPQGRPDRCVLATAWVKAEEAQGQNLYNLLFCPVFLNVQKQALYQCPVQAPKTLIENYNCPVSQNDPQFVIYNNNPNIGSWSFRSPDEVEVIGKLFPNLIRDGLKSLQILQSASYMETFSGTPLASGITYVPKFMPSDSAYVNGYDSPVQQSPSWNLILGFLFVIFFFLASLLAFDRLTNNSFINHFIHATGIFEWRNPDVQNTEKQNPEKQIPEGKNPEKQISEKQISEKQISEKQISDVQNTKEQNRGNQIPEGQNQEGQISEEQIPDVQNTKEQNTEEQNTEKQIPEGQTPNEQNLNWQNPNGQNSEQPIYPPEQPINPGYLPMKPNNGTPGAPLMEL